ncbi:MAG: NifB/NifX family molybdenum-iron cluster-binding protein [Nitrososphaerota archaeon]|nr:NifB/NifX family molybdenum-iron cluster-binding protein [Nitrososphaerota archaeon]
MKAAVVTDDLETVSAHFGMARHYLVYDIEEGAVKGREVRDKVGHGPGEHREGAETEGRLHSTMLSNIADCDVVISGGMGRPMAESIRAAGKKVFVTRVRSADDAVKALADGRLDNHLEFLH